MVELLNDIVKYAREYGVIRIIPKIDIDSLIAAGLLWKNLEEHNISATINFDLKLLVEETDIPTVLINLPKPERLEENKQLFNLVYNGKESVSAYVAYFLDKLFITSSWEKLLALIPGIYYGLDSEEGFPGLEKQLLKEIKENLSIKFGFKFWGRDRVGLQKAIYRTLIPFLPGYTGDAENVNNLLETVLGKTSGLTKYVSIEDDEKLAARFLEKLVKGMKIDFNTAKRIARKLLGNIYVATLNNKVVELNEFIGSSLVFMSIKKDNPYYIPLLSIDKELLFQILTIYEEVIDSLCLDISLAINTYIESKKEQAIIEIEEGLARPEIIIEIIKSIDENARKIPLIVSINGEYLTTVDELLRIGNEPSTVYSNCNAVQLCRVDEHGNFIRS